MMGYQHFVGGVGREEQLLIHCLRNKIFHYNICQSQGAIIVGINTIYLVPTLEVLWGCVSPDRGVWFTNTINLKKDVFLLNFKVWMWPGPGKDYWFNLRAKTIWGNILKKSKVWCSDRIFFRHVMYHIKTPVLKSCSPIGLFSMPNDRLLAKCY